MNDETTPTIEARRCPACDKGLELYHTHCSWNCHIEHAKKLGGRVFTPNNLPIKCITATNVMLEHEHGNHADYMFPVDVEYFGLSTPSELEQNAVAGRLFTKEELDVYNNETHALIYTDGYIAVTLDECCYAMWTIKDGKCMGGNLWSSKTHKLSQKSIDTLLEITKDKREAHENKETR